MAKKGRSKERKVSWEIKINGGKCKDEEKREKIKRHEKDAKEKKKPNCWSERDHMLCIYKKKKELMKRTFPLH